MKFYIVTPCFNALRWLQCCVRSVADQIEGGIEVHHHVQDGLSTDGTAAWLEQWQREHADTPGYTFTYESAKDAGMYDAINTAWSKLPADADVTAHLNADEQYLPRVLRKVATLFEQESQTDILEGTYIVIDAQENYTCHRRPITPNRWSSVTVCQVITCSAFHRVSTFLSHNIRYNTHYKAISDVLFFLHLQQAGVCIQPHPQLITSTYAVTGNNLAWTEETRQEGKEYWATLPPLYPFIHRLTNLYSNLRRRLCDIRYAPPREYALYEKGRDMRTIHEIQHPTSAWRRAVH